MKKILVAVLSVLAFAAVASAQPRAIGLRLGGDAEVSYQHSLGQNFAEFDLGLGFIGGLGIGAVGVYDFVFCETNLGNCPFNVYAGPGAALGMYKYTDVQDGKEVDTLRLDIGIVGQVGCELFVPGVPVQFSLDFRPCVNLIHYGWGLGHICLGVRYAF